MKKLVLSVILAAFAVAVQAGNTPATSEKASGDKDSSCCGKTPTATEAKGQCPMAKESKASCCSSMAKNATKETSTKPALQSPKAMADARR
jgi:hypothetical protein